MNVAELIYLLKNLHPEMEIFLGAEGTHSRLTEEDIEVIKFSCQDVLWIGD
jgi:hypothetical protein